MGPKYTNLYIYCTHCKLQGAESTPKVLLCNQETGQANQVIINKFGNLLVLHSYSVRVSIHLLISRTFFNAEHFPPLCIKLFSEAQVVTFNAC
jgi:hypothetical protein